MHDALSAKAFAHIVNTEGGASHNIQTAEPAKGPGVMVSIPGAEKITDAPLTPEQAQSFRDEHGNAASNNEYHGAWESNKKIFQDISRKEPTLEASRKSGVLGKQIAGYDLGGTDARRPEGGEIYFNREVGGHETDSEWKSTPEATSIPERMSPRPRATSQDFADQAHISRSATVGKRGRKGTRPISINEVYATIAKNRRNRGV